MVTKGERGGINEKLGINTYTHPTLYKIANL